MKTTRILAILVLALGLATEVANADFTFGTPTNLGPTVNDAYDVMGVCISQDGLELYFSSNRPGGYGGYDLVVSTRETKSDGWKEPVNLGEFANTPYDIWDPSLSTDGLTLYYSDPHLGFGNLHPGGLGGSGDIWMLTRPTVHDVWESPINLGPKVNNQHAICPHISSDDLSLYLTSHRAGPSRQCDIMVATRETSSEDFGKPVFLSGINSTGNDWAPEISVDGLTLFLMSNRENVSNNINSLKLWMANRASISEPFASPVKLPPQINVSGYGTFWPELSSDGSVLYFVSNRPEGLGGYDLWQVAIEPIVDLTGDGIVDRADMCIIVDHWGTDEPLCDIGPMPWGDGIVDVQDLIVLAEHLFEEVTPVE